MYECIWVIFCIFCIWTVGFLIYQYCILCSMMYDRDFALPPLAVQGPFLWALNMFCGCPLSRKETHLPGHYSSSCPWSWMSCTLPTTAVLSPERSHSVFTRLTWLCSTEKPQHVCSHCPSFSFNDAFKMYQATLSLHRPDSSYCSCPGPWTRCPVLHLETISVV